jgi:thiol:disulfide interchange protein
LEQILLNDKYVIKISKKFILNKIKREKMKKIFLGLLAVGMIGLAFTSADKKNDEKSGVTNVIADYSVDGIHFFKGSWESALEKAEDEGKLIFLDAYASWCGPCKRMAATTFKNKEVGDFFNKNFINFKMDMEKHKDGRRLSQKYRLTAYPTLYFIDASESIAHKSVGGLNNSQALRFGKEAIEKQ